MLQIFQTILLALLLLQSIYCTAQGPYMKQFTVDDGLPTNEVYYNFQDSKGFLWFGTDKGICRFDGQTFKKYTHPQQNSTSINRIVEDQQGRIWCNNFRNQLFYIEEDSMHIFSRLDSLLAGRPMNEYDIDCDQNLFISIKDTLIRHHLPSKSTQYYDLMKLFPKLRAAAINCKTNFSTIHSLNSIGCDTWLKLFKHWAVRYHKGKFHSLTCPSCHLSGKHSPPNSPCHNKESSMQAFEGKKGAVVFLEGVDQGHNLKKQASGISEVKYYYHLLLKDNLRLLSPFPAIQEEYHTGLYLDSKENLWAGSYKGVFVRKVFDVNAPTLQLLKNILVSSILEDHEGNIWLCTLSDGIFMVPSLEIINYTRENSSLHSNKIQKIIPLRTGELLIGTQTTQHPVLNIKTQKSNFSYYTPQQKMMQHIYYDSLYNLLEISQNQNYRFQYQQAKGIDLTNRIHPNKDVAFINEQYRLTATRIGAQISHRSNLEVISELIRKTISLDTNDFSNTSSPLLFNAAVPLPYAKDRRCYNVLVEDSCHFWLGYEHELVYYNCGKFTPVRTPADRAIVSTEILHGDNGSIWVSTNQQGIFQIRDQKVVKHYHQENGLLTNEYNSMIKVGPHLWAGSLKGVSRINTKTTAIRHFDKTDGLISNQVNDLTYYNGSIWIATSKGLVAIDTAYSSQNLIPPILYLYQVTVNRQQVALDSIYQLDYQQNNITIQFQALSYRSQGNFQYKYKVNGLSEEWVYMDAPQNEIRLMGLRPNTYQLEIYAINEDGVESEQPIELTFVINPPFWATWWFRSLIGLGIAGFLTWQFLQFRRRQRLLLQLERLKNQALQAQMNPHFIFNAMNAIQQLMANSSMKEALAYMARFARLIRQIFEISGEPAIDLEKEIDFLQLYLDLEQLRFKNKVEVDFVIDPALEEDLYSIPPLLIQPIIENCFKHGLLHKEDKGHLTVQLKKLGDFMYVLVEDDGVGRQRAGELQSERLQERKKSGLKVTRDRLLLLQQHPEQPGNIRITDLQGAEGAACGTRVELWIPFQHQNLEQL